MIEVTFTITPTGKVEIEVEGATGSICKNITEAYEKMLGTVVSTNEKPAFYHEIDNINQEVETCS